MPEQQVTSVQASLKTPLQHSRSGLWFLIVGATASLTHMVIFTLFRGHMWPELANACGFFVAFMVSFVGHRTLSFKDAQTTLAQSFSRFALTALCGFGCNELVFTLLLRVADWPDFVALGCALIVAAGQTFLLSRYWAFKR